MHFWSRSRAGAVAQGRDLRQRAARARAALRLRRRRAARPGGARRPRLPHGRAQLLPRTASCEPAAPHEALPAPGAHHRRARGERPRRLLHGRAAGRPGADRRQGARGGRGGGARRRGGVATSAWREEAADVLYHLTVLLRLARPRPGRRLRGAHWPSPLTPSRWACSRASTRCARSPRAQRHPAAPCSFIDDCETPVSAFLKLRGERPSPRLPARVGRARPARRALVVPRRAAAQRSVRWSPGASPGDPYALAAEEVARHRQAPCPTCRRSPAGPWGTSATTSCARSSRRGGAQPRPGGPARPRADALRRAGGLRPPAPQLRRSWPTSTSTRGATSSRLPGRRGQRSPRCATAWPARSRASAARPEPPRPGLRLQHRARRSSRRWSRGSSSTSTPATPSRWCPPSAGRRAVPVDPFSIYRGLRVVNPSPYMYFLDFGTSRWPGASPEPLRHGLAAATCRPAPIAGTRPRGETAEEDARIAEELLADEKERAEHVMLVDLGRNDLGRVCEYGTRAGGRVHGRGDATRTSCTSSPAWPGRCARTCGAMDALRAALPGGHALRRAQGPRDADHRRAGARQAGRPTAARSATSRYGGDLDTCIHIRTRGDQGRRRPRAGRRRDRRRRRARLRVRGVRVARRAGSQVRRRSSVAARPSMRPECRAVSRDERSIAFSSSTTTTRFTYNLVQYLGELGAEIESVRNDARLGRRAAGARL